MDRIISDRKSEKAGLLGESHKGSAEAGRTLAPPPFSTQVGIQPKLKIGASNDKFEQEADEVAEKVVQGIGPIQAPPGGEEGGKAEIQRKSFSPEAGANREFDAPENFSTQLNKAKSGGNPLPEKIKFSMSKAFGADFNDVRVHTGEEATKLTREIGAKAFAYGNDIFFGKGEFQPESKEGKKLLAHELTHVVQQGRGGVAGKVQRYDEETYARLVRQSSTIQNIFYRQVLSASRGGYDNVRFFVENNGSELIPGFQNGERRFPEQSHAGLNSVEILNDMRFCLSVIVNQGGNWEIIYERTEGAPMHFSRFNQPEATGSGGGGGQDLDLPNRRQIYGQIFEETGRTLQEAGVQMAGFTLEQVVLYLVGGAFIRVLGLLGRGAASLAMPAFRFFAQRRNGAAISQAINSLGRAEAQQFMALTQKAEQGALNAAETAQLRALYRRVELVLRRMLPSQLRLPPALLYRGSGAVDPRLLEMARTIRVTQGGITREAIRNSNVAIARVAIPGQAPRYISAGNLPRTGSAVSDGIHSEVYLLPQIHQLNRELRRMGSNARIEQIFTERIPCGTCGTFIRQHFPGANVYYSINPANVPGSSTAEGLMRIYGLL